MYDNWDGDDPEPTSIHIPIAVGHHTLAIVTHMVANEREANAHLIAAAPDLLEALVELRDKAKGLAGSDHEWIVEDAIEKAEAAIAKAKGLGEGGE